MMWDSAAFLGALTPKFYVALTGTSSLISGLILIFEWWYFRKYGISFIERVSLSPAWLGNGGEEAAAAGGGGGEEAAAAGEGRVRRNPLAPLRGAEYGRLRAAAGGGAPLTYYDMNLSAQEHQAWFTVSGCGEAGGAEPSEAAMARAWRERSPAARVAAARLALQHSPDCAPALLLLAEEDAPTVLEAERVLRRAWRCGEAAWRRSLLALGAGGGGAAAERLRRDAAVLAHVKRRLAWCARRLGRLREAARLLRELCRDAPPALGDAPAEALLELLLEKRAWGDAAALLARAEAGGEAGAALLYSAALLKARAAAAGAAGRAAEEARAALRRALLHNPRVAEYLLEERALAPPPEHEVRRGDSEALAYAFWHARHWRACAGALQQLAAARAAPPCPAPPPAAADRELLAPRRPAPRAPRLLPAAAAMCAAAAAATLLSHYVWPQQPPPPGQHAAAPQPWPQWPAVSAWLAATARRLHPARLMHLLSAL